MGIKHADLAMDTVQTIASTLLKVWVKTHHLELFAFFFFPSQYSSQASLLAKWFVTSTGNERMRITDTSDRGSQAVKSLQDCLLPSFALVHELILHQIVLSYLQSLQKPARAALDSI